MPQAEFSLQKQRQEPCQHVGNTGKSSKVMSKRRELIYHRVRMEALRTQRCEILSSTLRHGAMWEREHMPTASMHSLLIGSISEYDKKNALRRYAHDDLLLPERCFAVQRTPSANSNKYGKRLGAKKAKELEHATSEKDSQRLTPEGASIYRALSAR